MKCLLGQLYFHDLLFKTRTATKSIDCLCLKKLVFTITDCFLVNDSPFSKVFQVIYFDLFPWYVGDTNVCIPKLLVLLFYTFVQSPCNLHQADTQRSQHSLLKIQYFSSSVKRRLESQTFTTRGQWTNFIREYIKEIG